MHWLQLTQLTFLLRLLKGEGSALYLQVIGLIINKRYVTTTYASPTHWRWSPIPLEDEELTERHAANASKNHQEEDGDDASVLGEGEYPESADEDG